MNSDKEEHDCEDECENSDGTCSCWRRIERWKELIIMEN
jgi:hypothetical protein